MKESFKRIVDWTKKHPWLAGGILAGVVVLAWLSYKNGWFGGGGGSSASVDTSTPPTDTSGGTLPPVVGGVGGDTGGTTTPPQPVTLPPVGNVGGGGGGDGFTLPASSNLDNLFGGTVSVAPDAGTQPQAADAYTANVGTAARAISQGADLVATHSGVDNSTPTKRADAYTANVGTAAKGASQGITLVRDTSYPSGAPIISSNFPQVTGTGGAGSKNTGGGVKVKSGRTTALVSVSKTPAAILGLASNYTGWYGNIYYLNGYPSTQQVNANTSSGRTLGIS